MYFNVYVFVNRLHVYAGVESLVCRTHSTGVRRKFNAYQNNKQSEVKAKNLYAIMYSKYFTQRFVLQHQNKDKVEVTEDDKAIKARFAEVFADDSVESAQAMNNRYLAIVRNLKRPDVALHYDALDEQINRNEMDESTKELFYIGSSQTDVFLETKLAVDLNRFKTRRERASDFLQKYRFINGWITALGVSVFTGISAFSKK